MVPLERVEVKPLSVAELGGVPSVAVIWVSSLVDLSVLSENFLVFLAELGHDFPGEVSRSRLELKVVTDEVAQHVVEEHHKHHFVEVFRNGYLDLSHFNIIFKFPT